MQNPFAAMNPELKKNFNLCELSIQSPYICKKSAK